METRPDLKTKIFFPNLDGLRFIAFFLVFFHHSLIVACFSTDPASAVYEFINNQKENGALGVNLFFVLSGFLITYLLLSEKTKYATIHVTNFYLRRVLRIWPLYFLMVVAGFIIFPLIKKMMGGIPDETHTAGYYMFFISNFQMVAKGFADSSILNVLWSVGVEEQFYFVWPVVLLLTPKKYLLSVFGILILGTLIFRYINAGEARINYYHTFAVFSDMVIGGVAAYYSFYSLRFIDFFKKLPRKNIIIIYALMLLVIAFRYLIFTNVIANTFQRLLLSLFFAFVILEQNFATFSFYKISRSKFLSRWGNYTYGLYCLHTIGLLIAHIISEKLLKLNNNWLIMGIDFTVGFGLSMIMAYISYTYFEAPFLKLKNKFAYFTK
jgi:peptidoglycan/LPS O-acetylase OafA/YrhL